MQYKFVVIKIPTTIEVASENGQNWNVSGVNKPTHEQAQEAFEKDTTCIVFGLLSPEASQWMSHFIPYCFPEIEMLLNKLSDFSDENQTAIKSKFEVDYKLHFDKTSSDDALVIQSRDSWLAEGSLASNARDIIMNTILAWSNGWASAMYFVKLNKQISNEK